MGRHNDDNSNGIADHAEANPYIVANQADPDPYGLDPYGTGDGSYPEPAVGTSDFEPENPYDFPDPGWRPESDFTGEWVEELVAGDPDRTSP